MVRAERQDAERWGDVQGWERRIEMEGGGGKWRWRETDGGGGDGLRVGGDRLRVE